MTDSIHELGRHLERVTGAPRFSASSEKWGNPMPMSQALARVERSFKNPLVPRGDDRRSVAGAVLGLREARDVTEHAQIKYACIGASQEFSGWCLFEDRGLLEILLYRAASGSDQQRLKYFACLLCSYWTFPRDEEKTSAAAHTGWVRLRLWLNAQRTSLDRSVKTKPYWFPILNAHANLLSDHPCARYGLQLLNGNNASLQEALESLAVPSESWLRNEAIIAQMQAATELSDGDFLLRLSHLVDTASGKTEFRLSRSISIRCLALLVSRYAACAATPEHIPLRDASITFVGNPSFHRAAWDSYVLDKNGFPDDRARDMMNGWLKVRLIKDFFSLLSEDRSADGRRLNYWLGFEPLIDEMWFALGADALGDPRKDYVEFRQRANGRLLELTGSTPTLNNAFLMHLGDYLIIEFGITGNACFIYKYDRLPHHIKRRLTRAEPRGLVDIAELKARGREARLLHNGSWEANFDAVLCPLLKFTPPVIADGRISRRVPTFRNAQDRTVERTINATPPVSIP